MATPAAPAITLQFADHLRVPGETIAGHVVLDVASAQQEKINQLRVKFVGSIKTYAIHMFLSIELLH